MVGEKFMCRFCGYLYDPVKGDHISGIAPGTEFEDLPEDWKCLICDSTRAKFESIDELGE